VKPFAVRYRDTAASRPKLSALRFTTSKDAREYAERLIAGGAVRVAVVQLDGRRYVSSQSVISAAPG
jgi:hypothetical protein